MKNFNDIEQLLKADIIKLNQTIISQLSSDVVLINQISAHIINSGGKRLRPLVLILCAKALNYKGKQHHKLAAVIEFIHTATLLHDDVVDESCMRRGKETANETWGNAPSVLTGDFLYSRAFEMMVEIDSMAVMSVLSKTTNVIAQGEVMQLLNCRNAELSTQDYYKTIKAKTAVLFEASSKLAGIIEGVNIAKQEALATYGLELGNAFQIIDDVLDYQSDVITMGKEVGDDLSEGKTTLPIIYALEHANDKDKQLLTDAIVNADNSQIKQIIAILIKLKAFDYARKQAGLSIDKAKSALDILDNSPAKDALYLLAELSLKRQA